MDVYRVTRGFTVDLNRQLKIYLEQIRKNPPWLSMAMWKLLMKRVVQIKYDIYWNQLLYYCSKASTMTSWDFVWKIFYTKQYRVTKMSNKLCQAQWNLHCFSFL